MVMHLYYILTCISLGRSGGAETCGGSTSSVFEESLYWFP
jgi:hypothetical protein